MTMARFLLVLFAASAATAARAQDLNDQLETMSRAAVARVAPTVVQIVTQGGLDMVVASPKGPMFRKAIGPDHRRHRRGRRLHHLQRLQFRQQPVDDSASMCPAIRSPMSPGWWRPTNRGC